jgi:hypothetical protein
VDAGGAAGAEAQPPRHHPAELAKRFLCGFQLREGAPGVLQQQRLRGSAEEALADPSSSAAPQSSAIIRYRRTLCVSRARQRVGCMPLFDAPARRRQTGMRSNAPTIR